MRSRPRERGSAPRRTALVAAVIASGVCVAFVANAAGAGKAGWQATVVYRQNQDWTTFDMQVYESRGSSLYTLPAYQRLVVVGKNGKLVGDLAKSWTVTPNSVTFKLRRDAKCSDGEKVTPLVVAQSFERLVTVPKVTSNFGSGFGPGPYHITANRFAGTFTFSVDNPWSPLIYGFADAATGIVCPAGLNALKSDPKALQTQMYGSGPYTLASATHGSQIVYKLRHDYTWGPLGTTWRDLPETLIYKIIPDETTAANLLLTREITFGPVAGTDIPRLLADKSLTHYAVPAYSTDFLSFNMFPGHVTEDLKVRQALVTAIDAKAFNQAAFSGYGAVSPSIFTPRTQCYSNTAKFLPKPSIANAQAVLRSDGYTLQNGVMAKDGHPLHIVLNGLPTLGQGPQYLAAVWQQVGFDVDLKNDTATGFGIRAINGQFDVSMLGSADNAPTPAAGATLRYVVGPPLPKGFNIGNSAASDTIINNYAAKAFSTSGKTACSWFAKVQQRLLTQFYTHPLAAPLFEWFGNGVTFIPGPRSTFEPWSIRKKG